MILSSSSSGELIIADYISTVNYIAALMNRCYPLSLCCFHHSSGSGGHLPLEIEHWTRGAECFKSNNKQKDCFRAAHCVVRDGNFCSRFRNGRMVGFGNDLATVMYYHKMTQSNPGCWTVDLNGGTTWAMGE